MRHAEVLVLGAGPAGLMLAAFLHRVGLEVLVVGGPERFGLLRPLTAGGERFNLLPVFAALDTELERRLCLRELCGDVPAADIDYRHRTARVERPNGPPDSFRSRICAFADGLSLVLAAKQFGDALLDQPLRLLRDKIERHYRPGGPARRMGVVNGVSPYLIWLEANTLQPTLPLVPRAIDLQRHLLDLDGEQIDYGTLIVSIPLPSFLSLSAMVRAPLLIGQGVAVRVYLADTPLTANRVVYDCNPASPIFRLFIPSPHVITVQMARQAWDAPDESVLAGLRTLDAEVHSVNPYERVTLPLCYPLDCEPWDALACLIGILRQYDVYLFGRLAEWRYADIHELDWGIVDRLAEHLGATEGRTERPG